MKKVDDDSIKKFKDLLLKKGNSTEIIKMIKNNEIDINKEVNL
jgi:hypothetical protein